MMAGSTSSHGVAWPPVLSSDSEERGSESCQVGGVPRFRPSSSAVSGPRAASFGHASSAQAFASDPALPCGLTFGQGWPIAGGDVEGFTAIGPTVRIQLQLEICQA